MQGKWRPFHLFTRALVGMFQGFEETLRNLPARISATNVRNYCLGHKVWYKFTLRNASLIPTQQACPYFFVKSNRKFCSECCTEESVFLDDEAVFYISQVNRNNGAGIGCGKRHPAFSVTFVGKVSYEK